VQISLLRTEDNAERIKRPVGCGRCPGFVRIVWGLGDVKDRPDDVWQGLLAGFVTCVREILNQFVCLETSAKAGRDPVGGIQGAAPRESRCGPTYQQHRHVAQRGKPQPKMANGKCQNGPFAIAHEIFAALPEGGRDVSALLEPDGLSELSQAGKRCDTADKNVCAT